MERLLTKKDGKFYFKGKEVNPQYGTQDLSPNENLKLYNYFAELEDKLESGQLVDLKFYIGQPLYLVGNLLTLPVMEECKIKECYTYHGHTYADIVGSVGQPLERNYDLTENAHGFIFSKEEAEQRLAELKQ